MLGKMLGEGYCVINCAEDDEANVCDDNDAAVTAAAAAAADTTKCDIALISLL